MPSPLSATLKVYQHKQFNMSSEFALDLRLARRKAGLTQGDIAHLLARHQSFVSELEHGRRLPTIHEIVSLSLIYGRSFESLFATVMQEAKAGLRRQLRTLPDHVRQYAGTFNRAGSLERMRRRFQDDEDHGGGA